MLSPGTVLQQRYHIIDKIGQGGMGAVYRATDQRLGHQVALKQTLVDSPQFARALEREARLLASLRHPALPKVSDHWQDEHGHFLVMEYIPGDDLAALMQKQTHALPVDVVLRWADQLLDGLRYLHSQQPPIIHRDIKPHNIKITPNDEPILLDFGLAKGMVDLTLQTSASMYAYTLQYAPLEQIHGQPTDQRSDLYSLAATIYFLMSGAPPVNAVARAAALATEQPDPLRQLINVRRDMPPQVDAVIRQGLSLAIDRRPASATAFRQLLAGAVAPTLAGTSTVAAPPPADAPTVAVQPPVHFVAPPPASAPAARQKARFPLGIALSAVVLIAILVLLGGVVLRGQNQAASGGAAQPTVLADTTPSEADAPTQEATPEPTAALEPTAEAAPEEQTQQAYASEIVVGQTAYVTMSQELPLWVDPEGSAQVTERPLLTRGAELAVLEVLDNAIQIRTIDSVDGWLLGTPADLLTAEPPIYAEQDNYGQGTRVVFISPDGIPLRDGPNSGNAKVVERVAAGTAGDVAQQQGDWVEVTLDSGETGWARWFYNGQRYVVPEAPSFTRTIQRATPSMSGDDVLYLQRQLLVLGYNQPDNLDGIYGPRTQEQVRVFQEQNDLDADGVVGSDTWQRLFDGSAKAFQS